MAFAGEIGERLPSPEGVPLSILIAWHDRDEISTTLRQNAPHFKKSASEILVINCGGNAEVLRSIIADIGDPNIIQVNVPSEKFNKSLALNLGIALAKQDIILTLDCDICIGPEVLGKGSLCAQEKCFLTFAGLVEAKQFPPPNPLRFPSFLKTVVSEGSSEFFWEDGTTTKVLMGRLDIRDGTRLGPGMTIAKRQDLLDIGGFCSDFNGWGWEDIDLHLRLQRSLGLRPVYLNDAVVHLAHDEKKKTNRNRMASHEANFNLACERYNGGNFIGTHTSDIACWLHTCTILKGKS